ncbi:MAG TPA: exopolyphosphatase [Steroidobacteraceae bacterium]|jgi:exopolyphosphatase/guanosine-5'-triphosphate,3'-diphosphate pyrophosphatase|nr:exopolyphosphatase [Steroidobacteraceae bacterium]
MSDVIAAVDLGSNSFHMVVARYSHGQLAIIDRLREMVRLAVGVGEDGRLDKAVAARALACLERFGQRLRDIEARNVRVVGTNALRIARRKQAFLERAREALGFPIEIVSGMEEARLIYSGVAHNLPNDSGRRLVVDIGGGSTEIIIGERFDPLELESLQMGCVSVSQKFFGDGRLSDKRIERARLAARLELEPIQAAFQKRGWERAVGSSGTVRVIADSIRELEPSASGITPQGLEKLLRKLADSGSLRELDLDSVSEERRPVFPGGVVILAEIIAALGIEQMRFVEGALRDGLLYDMVGRMTRSDPRERTVASMARRYHVDGEQAERVEATAVAFLQQVKGSWGLEDPVAEQSLRWGAQLHEIGLDVAHNGYHRHGAYLLENADMPGFAREEQLLMARLVGSHRRKLTLERLEDLIPPWDKLAIYLIVLLRLAVLLHRGRSTAALPNMELMPRGRTLELRFPARWLNEHPLTVGDLQLETEFLRPQGLRLRVFSGARAS